MGLDLIPFMQTVGIYAVFDFIPVFLILKITALIEFEKKKLFSQLVWTLVFAAFVSTPMFVFMSPQDFLLFDSAYLTYAAIVALIFLVYLVLYNQAKQ